MSARRQRVCVGRRNGNSPRQEVDKSYELFNGSRGNITSPRNVEGNDMVGRMYTSTQNSPRTNPEGGQRSTDAVPFLPSLPSHSHRNTRSGANPHYPLSMTRHMVQSDQRGAGYISPRDQFGPERYTLQQQKDREQRLALQCLHASLKGRAEKSIIDGRDASDKVREAKEAMRIEVKRQQRESYEQRVAEISERERRSARQWL